MFITFFFLNKIGLNFENCLGNDFIFIYLTWIPFEISTFFRAVVISNGH